MASDQLSSVTGYLRRILRAADVSGLTDGQLLDCFLARHDEAAFEALVRRHGPMVLGVCRRVLRDLPDAEDAFQATFLVFVRKAASLGKRELVGNWLYGVAYRTALKAKATAARRRAKERQVGERPEPAGLDDQGWQELQAVLDQELHRLPDKYRVPLVLCYLEGKTKREAALELGCPEGTLSCRLARARAMLAKRLVRHSLVFSAGSLLLAHSAKTASAAVPGPLVVSTVKAATLSAVGKTAAAGMISAEVTALTEGVLKAMLLSKLKIVGVLWLVFAVAGIGGVLTNRRAAAEPAVAGKSRLEQQEASVPPAKDRRPVVALLHARQNVGANDDGDQNNNNDGQKGQKDDGDQNNNNDGQKGQKDDGNQNNNDDGQKGQKDDGNQNNNDDGQKNQKDDDD